MSKKLYIGYDLGDGETITDFALINSEKNFNTLQYSNMTMPNTTEPGRAIPTVYGYDEKGKVVFSNVIINRYEKINDIAMNFKRKPMDLIEVITNQAAEELVQILDNEENSWPQIGILNTPKLLEYRKKVIDFTNAVFGDSDYMETIRGYVSADHIDEIVITVGHPTKWSRLDALIYKRILKGSLLGKETYAGAPLSLVLAQESRAAFLYERQVVTGLKVKKDTCIMLIDIGSSTIDITALTADSRNSQYNSGSNYLGARAIDWLIFEWYLSQLFQKNIEFKEDYADIIRNNPTAEMSLLLNCRKAKENVFSTRSLDKIVFADFPSIRLEPDTLNELIEKKPIACVLDKYTSIPECVKQEMGDKSWTDLLKEFLEAEKAALSKNHTVISQIIFTGSASRMPAVKEMTKKVFKELFHTEEGNMMQDIDPARTISKGLVSVGISNDKSAAFQKDLQEIIHNRIPQIIGKDIPALIDGTGKEKGIGDAMADMVEKIVFQELNKWKGGTYKTIDETTEAIKKECSEEKLSECLKQDRAYMKAVEGWYKNKISKDIAFELQELCKKYNVQKEFRLKDLSIADIKMDITTIDGSRIVDLDMIDIVGGVVGLIAGIIAYIALPTVLGIIIGIISLISVTIAGVIFGILALIPGPGWVIICGIAGIAMYQLITDGVDSVKQKVSKKVVSENLPLWVRTKVSDEKIKSSFRRTEFIEKLRDSMQTKENKEKIINGLTSTLNTQVNVIADEIKYAIESL